jgi:lantibiotic biosynthesis protein
MSHSANMKMPFTFLDELVLRTPAMPFVDFLDEEKIKTLLDDNNFMEAVYLASPVLHAECIRLKEDNTADEKEIKKVRTSLIKYYQRMYSRCTPFGLFSGCSLVEWSDKPSNIILPSDNFLRSTRLDMHYLCALGQYLSSLPVIKQRLKYFPNNSAYRMGGEIRYIEYRYLNGKRVHQINSVLHADYLVTVLKKASNGATIGDLTNLLVSQHEVTDEEAMEFIDELIVSQVLISEMDPAITGEEFIHQLLGYLHKINSPQSTEITNIISQLDTIIDLLAQADSSSDNFSTVYSSVLEKIKELGVSFEEGKLFQVDMYSRPVEKIINEAMKDDLLQTIPLLAKLFSSTANENLSSFADKFRKRYEDQQVSLSHVLDAETGIGYTDKSGNNLSPLLENLFLPQKNDSSTYEIKWNKKEEWIFNQLIRQPGVKEIFIDDKELTDFTIDYSSLPPSLSVMFSVVEGGKIIFKGCSGSSAANLLGRFAHADENILKLVEKITRQECQLNEDIIFAEIIHLPEDRVGNILLHPAFHKYEIPFLAQSSMQFNNQVLLQDIFISVAQDKHIRLFSKKLGKEIIPRLSNAHNYSFGALPVYQFLADMQTQDLVGGLAFNWGGMARQFRYLPRVNYGNIILFEATWQLRKEDFIKLISATELTKEVVADFQTQWQLPRYFVLAEGDNELLVDIQNKYSLETFVSAIKRKDSITLKEFLFPDGQTVKDENGNRYNNQFVAVLMNNQKVYTGLQPVTAPVKKEENIQRKFLPGSEWLYYKIYCGSKMADEILTVCILPFTEELLQGKLIDKWFFIRYYDPEFHLRVRFHIKGKDSAGEVAETFLSHIEAMDKEGFVSQVQIDTYQREIERYGDNLIEQAEDIFFLDSKIKLKFLSLTEGDERERFRWLWGFRGVDELLNAFEYPLETKYELMQSLKEVFYKEFNTDKSLFRQLNHLYTESKKMIQIAMENPVAENNEMKPLLDIYEENKNEFKKIAKYIIDKMMPAEDRAGVDNLLSSYIHMNLNRLFLSEPRLHEMVIYDFLCSYYRTLIKKSKS